MTLLAWVWGKGKRSVEDCNFFLPVYLCIQNLDASILQLLILCDSQLAEYEGVSQEYARPLCFV